MQSNSRVTTANQHAQLIELAQKVLGTIIMDGGNESMVIAKQLIGPNDFFSQSLCDFAGLLWDMDSRDVPLTVDMIVLEHEQREHNIEHFGFMFSQCIERGNPANLEYECRILAQFATARRLSKIYHEGLTKLTKGGDPFAVSDDINTHVDMMMETFVQAKSTHISETDLDGFFDKMLNSDGLLGITTGYSCLDESLSGFAPSDLIIIGGRPGMGKTALMLCFMLHAARAGNHCVFFSLEMSAIQLAARLVVIISGISATRIRAKQISTAEREKLKAAIVEVKKLPIYIEDSSYTIEDIRTKAKYLAKFGKVDMMFMDYIQLAASTRSNSMRYTEIGDVTRGLKRLAKDLHVPCIAGSQLGRDSAGREPTMVDLRESGDIENDADLIILAHRPEYYVPKGETVDPEIKGLAKLIIEKFRHGSTGFVLLRFLGPITKFTEWTDGGGQSDDLPFDTDNDGKIINQLNPNDNDKVPF